MLPPNHPGKYRLAIVEGNIVRVSADYVEKLPEGSVVFKEDDHIDLMALPKDFPRELMEQVRTKIYDENGLLMNVFWTYPRWLPPYDYKKEPRIT